MTDKTDDRVDDLDDENGGDGSTEVGSDTLKELESLFARKNEESTRVLRRLEKRLGSLEARQSVGDDSKDDSDDGSANQTEKRLEGVYALVAAGVNKKLAKRLMKDDDLDWDDDDELLDRYRELGLVKSNDEDGDDDDPKVGRKSKTVKDSRGTKKRDVSEPTEYTPDYVQEQLAKLSGPEAKAKWLKDHERQIDAYQRKHFGGVKSIPPGHGLKR